MIVFAFQTYNYFATPFLLLFVLGYWWAGFGTLYQEYQGRLRWLRQRRLAVARQVDKAPALSIRAKLGRF